MSCYYLDKEITMTLKELRLDSKLSQEQCADLLGVSTRTFQRYERNEVNVSPKKMDFIYKVIEDNKTITEDKGILEVEEIKNICASVFKDKDIDFCYLFGSYAKGYAKDNSDVDLVISTSITGLAYFGLIEELRENLHKKVDVITLRELSSSPELLKDVLKDGIKIYG